MAHDTAERTRPVAIGARTARRTAAMTTRRAASGRGGAPDPATLDPAERMGADELRALQLTGCSRRCGTPTRTCRTTGRAFDAAGVHPDDCRELGRPREVPDDQQGRPARELPVRHVRRPARAGPPGARLVRHDRHGRPSSATPRATSTPGPRSWPGPSARRAGGPATCCTTPTATACSPAGSARTTARRSSAARSSRSPGA